MAVAKRECLICFGIVRATWRQPLPVPCRCLPALHKECWNQWMQHAGPVCVICRSIDRRLAPPQHQEGAFYQLIRHGIDRASGLFMVFLLFYFIILVLRPAPADVPQPMTGYPPWPSARDL